MLTVILFQRAGWFLSFFILFCILKNIQYFIKINFFKGGGNDFLLFTKPLSSEAINGTKLF